MALTSDQLKPLAREAVQRLLGALESERLVARFVDGYVAATGRTGLKESPLRYRELLHTIGREALLAMLAKVEALLPRKLSGTRARKPTPRAGAAAAQAAGVFREGLLDTLAQALLWMPSERQEFGNDLELYARMAARAPRAMKMKARRPAYPTEGAFVDRCALLLDPSLLDKARIAAGKFQVELEAVAERTTRLLFKGRRP